jgi:hypothetical protein
MCFKVGRSSSPSPANGSSDSDSTPRARSTVIPPAASTASSSNTLFPIPGSPVISNAALVPDRAPDTSSRTLARSESRPNSTSDRVGIRPPRRHWGFHRRGRGAAALASAVDVKGAVAEGDCRPGTPRCPDQFASGAEAIGAESA